jgi:hypothetical protein
MVTLVALAAMPAYAATTPVYRMWRISRTTKSAQHFSVTVAFQPVAARAMWVLYGVRGTGRHRSTTNTIGIYGDTASNLPLIRHVAGYSVEPCPGTPGCDVAVGGTGAPTYRLESEGPVTDEFFVVADSAAPTFTWRDPHWRVREVSPTRIARVTAAGETSTGIGTRAGYVERYDGSSAAGGPYGSVAWAFIPCDEAGVGTGELRATGPRDAEGPYRMDCGAGYASAGFFNVASVTRATRWEVTAAVTGVGSYDTRLLVVDLPKG